MGTKGTDRRTKLAAVVGEVQFVLPENLSCSEVSFPALLSMRATANWNEILEESETKKKEIETYIESKNVPIKTPPFLKTECDYMQQEIFTLLLPALEETLRKAKLWDALLQQKCFFNGVDHIAQVLWNNNPRYPYRKDVNLHLFNMPWVRKELQTNPRAYYPKSWLWPNEYAATMIQKTVRQFFVQREEDVQEMRDFWRKLEIERKIPEIKTNPMLAKTFALSRDYLHVAHLQEVGQEAKNNDSMKESHPKSATPTRRDSTKTQSHQQEAKDDN